MSSPTWLAAGTQTDKNGTGSLAVPAPSGHAAGDLLIISTSKVFVPGVTVSTPAGWTLLNDSGDWTAAYDDRWRSCLFWKLAASGSEPAVTLNTSTGDSTWLQAQMYAFRGVKSSGPIDATGGWGAVAYGSGPASGSPPTTAVTTASLDTLIVYFGQDHSDSNWDVPPAGATQQIETVRSNAKFRVATQPKASIGLRAADVWHRVFSTAGSRCFTLAIASPVVVSAPVADFTGTPLSGAVPLSVAFTDTSTNTPTSWLWDFGDGTTSTAQNPTHSYAAGGVYTVALAATNSGGSNTKTRTGYVTATEAVVYVAGGGVTIW